MAELRPSSTHTGRRDRATRCISDVFQFLKDSELSDGEDGEVDSSEKRHSEIKRSQSHDTGIKNLSVISNKPDLLADIDEKVDSVTHRDSCDIPNGEENEICNDDISANPQDIVDGGWVSNRSPRDVKQNSFEHVCVFENHVCVSDSVENSALKCDKCNICNIIKTSPDGSQNENFQSKNNDEQDGSVFVHSSRETQATDSVEIPNITADITSCRIGPEGSSRSNSPCGLSGGETGLETDTCEVEIRRKENHLEEEDDHDSSDDDSGIYNETTRNSSWIMLDEDRRLNLPSSIPSEATSSTSDIVVDSETTDNENERVSSDVFDNVPSDEFENRRCHKRTDSTATTASEREFQSRSLVFRRKYFVQRKFSSQEYHRMSTRFYDQEKQIVMVKRKDEKDFGLHILDSHPAIITDVEPESPAAKHGIQRGQIVISVNDVNVLESSHDEIIQLMQRDSNVLRLEIGMCDVQQARDLQAPALQGYMHKLGTQPVVKIWSKRFFVLRHDNVLYYYKNDTSQDPMGAIPLMNYSISRYVDTKKDNCFKLEKYGARTYYFQTDTREDMRKWVTALRTAVDNSKDRKDSWMDITSHNVGLPALEIKKPECTGFLTKEGYTRKTWKKRYCVLKDGCIYYYKTVNSTSAQGVAHLHGYTVDENVTSGKRNGFALRPPEETMRTFYFCADNNTDKMRWVESIKSTLERWIKVD